MDFGLSRFDTALRTQRLELPEVTADGTPTLTLILTQISASNSRYHNWLLKRAPLAPASIPAEGTPEHVDYTDARTAEMVGAVSIVGWEHVLGDGQPAPCTPEHAIDFMRQLAQCRPDVFRRVSNFVIDPANWQSATPPTDATALGKE